MTIQLTQARVVSGSVTASGTQVTLSEADEAYFVQNGWAIYVAPEPSPGRTAPAFIAESPIGGVTLNGPSGYIPIAYTRKVRGIKGQQIIDFAGAGFLPAGTSFSGSGTYNSLGRLAVQSTGTLVHNPTGWSDGTACFEFTPNADAAEFRMYFDGTTGFTPLNFNDVNGIALEFEITDVDTSKSAYSISMEFSNDAASAFPANRAGFNWFVNNNVTGPTYREFRGKKYYRFRFDSLTTDAKSGPWPGYGLSATLAGTGADYTKSVNYLRFTVNKFSGKTVKFKRLLLGGVSTPCIVFGTDNAGPTTLSRFLAPVLAVNQVAAYANQYWAELDGDPNAIERYRRMYAAGWEINGNDLIDRPLGADVLDQPTMASAIQTTRNRCMAEGWLEGSRVWVANNNSTSYLMIQELQRAGYVANRNGVSEGRYVFPEGGVPDPYRIPGTSLDGKFLADIQPMIDRCIEYGATMWLYFHNIWSKAQIDNDRTNNVTGVSGAPMAVTAGQTPLTYRQAAVTLNNAVGNATVAYLDSKIGTSTAYASFYEDILDIVNYIITKQNAGALVTRRPSDWCRDVGLLPG